MSTFRQVQALQSNLPKVISPANHGLIDYAHAAFFFTVGLVCSRSNKRAAQAAFATSGLMLAQSLLTDYRYGWKPWIPFATHGRIDSVFASSSWLVPWVFGFSGSRAAKIFEGSSLAVASVVGMTQWDNTRARKERLAA